MALETLTVTLTGCRPLILHNGQLADPRNEHTRGIKPIAKKRDKTEDDYAELQRLEWLGGLYRDAAGRISVTEDMILMCMIEGARKTKKGKQATAGVLGASPFFPIEYDGPSDPIELFETGAFCDYRGVVVSMSRTMRARPRFDRWSVLVELLVDTTVINADEVIAALEVAGRVIGLGDYRPRYGRFTVDA